MGVHGVLRITVPPTSPQEQAQQTDVISVLEECLASEEAAIQDIASEGFSKLLFHDIISNTKVLYPFPTFYKCR